MTREEAIEILQHLAKIISSGDYQETFKMAVSALRPVSRERVERVWRSYWDGFSNGYADGYEVFDEWQCRKCGFEVETDEIETLPRFCPVCGAPMTDKGMQMVMERLEALHDNRT